MENFWDRPTILAEVPEFKGEFSGLAPNSTTLRNESLCILVCGLLSVVCGLRSTVRRSVVCCLLSVDSCQLSAGKPLSS